MEITLPDGMTIRGTYEQLFNALTKLGHEDKLKRDVRVWHYSESKDKWFKITEMPTLYLRNCVMKLLREWLDMIGGSESPAVMVNLIASYNNPQLTSMCAELLKRDNWTSEN